MIISHWEYFLALCSDVEKIGRYVDITPANYKTFSVEFARLLLSLGSEIDIVAKQLCDKIKTLSNAENIRDYRKVITAKYPDFPQISVNYPRALIDFVPWASWSKCDSPAWWKSYNNVKH